MADGSYTAIELIEPGDQVLAFDEATGEWANRAVLDQWSHLDTGDMVTVQMTDGSSVSATDHHLFWVTGENAWVEAEDLEPGDLLVDPDGPVEVADVSYWPEGPNTVWELTVDTDHTFTVHTGTADVVVHNSSCTPQSWRESPDRSSSNYPFSASNTGSSVRLGDNLAALGDAPRAPREYVADGITTTRPADQAHHIVPKGLSYGQRARNILQRYKIDIDDPANGVWLEGQYLSDSPHFRSPDPAGRATHGGVNGAVHTEAHVTWIADQLEAVVDSLDGESDAVIRQALLDRLGEIKGDLIDGIVGVAGD